jgi:hypothetical protein
MKDVVESGTARRVFNTFVRSDKRPYTIGGKTGTGDHRYETYGPGGHLISSRVVNRTATFAFYVGDRFFGVISAHVPGAEAAKFDFTSALAAELLKILSPALVPMIEQSGAELSPFSEDPPAALLTKTKTALPETQKKTGPKEEPSSTAHQSATKSKTKTTASKASTPASKKTSPPAKKEGASAKENPNTTGPPEKSPITKESTSKEVPLVLPPPA